MAHPLGQLNKWRLPLHVPVAVLFSVLILGVGSIITAFHFHEMRQLLESANTALFRALADRASETVYSANNTVRRSFILLASSPLADAQTYAERLRFLPELTGLLAADPLLVSVMIGYGNGDFFLVSRAPADSRAAWHVLDISRPLDAEADGSALLSRFDAQLRLIDVRPQAEHFEPRLTDWYKKAAASDNLVVMPPRLIPFENENGVTFARRNGAEVFGVNIGFSNFSRMLGRIPMTAGTRLTLTTLDGRTLVSSVMQAPSSPDIQIPAATAEDPHKEIVDSEGAARLIESKDGTILRVSSLAIEGFGSEDWRLIVETPEEELLADAYRLRRTSAIFTALAVLLSFPLAWALSRLLTKPLHRLAHLARALSSLQFQPQPVTRSVILEVDQLGGAMAMMRTAIARFLEMGRDLGSKRDVKSVLDEVAASAKEISGATWSKVSIAEESLHDAPPAANSDEWEPLARQMATAEGPASLVKPISDLPAAHVLGVPLRTPEGENLGTLLLGNYRGDHDGLARGEVAGFLVALAGSAAVALENQRLLKGRKDLLRGVIRMVADAIDAKSPYTGGHCRRVTEVARRLAVAAHETQSGPLSSFQLDASGWEALEIASWLHDCGKLTTPEFVIDKATKLETLYNRIHEIRTRFEVLKRDVEISYWREVAGGGDEPSLRATRDAELHALDEDFAFVAACNLGSENMPESALRRLDRIAARHWTRTLDDRLGLSGPELARLANQPLRPIPARETLLSDTSDKIVERPNRELFEPDNPWGFVMDVPEKLYNHGELYNLRIRRGTLSEEERFKIKEHIVQTIVMLSRLPFPRDLANVPEMAGAHHETMDGRGYPKRLNASEMSVTARIMAIADIFEALTALDRPYRQPNSPEDALVIMKDFCNRKVIDPDLFELLVSRELWRDDWETQVRTVRQTDVRTTCPVQQS